MAAPGAFSDSLLAFLTHWQPVLMLLAPTLVFISALIAWRAIGKNQDVNRRRATIDLIEKSESSEYYRTVAATFLLQFSDDRTADQRAALYDPKTEDEKKARREIQ